MITATVSGSFHRHLHAIYLAVNELTDRGVRVLSPADPRVVDSVADFLFVASDQVRSVRMVQDRHIECIRASSFLWLVAPDGYVGQSASMEIGFAVAHDVPIFCADRPSDLTLMQYVQQVRSSKEAIQACSSATRTKPTYFLIDPHAAVEKAQVNLDRIHQSLHRARDPASDAANDVYARCANVTALVTVPGRRSLRS
jgi:CTP:molybdopterin cytidylyltransferase MocA